MTVSRTVVTKLRNPNTVSVIISPGPVTELSKMELIAGGVLMKELKSVAGVVASSDRVMVS